MSKNLLLIIIAVVLVVLAGLVTAGYLNGNGKQKIDTSGLILFYGQGCPHCKNVDDFITQNKVEEKVKFARLEVFNNKDNDRILLERAQACGLPLDQVGVPFLWDGANKKCIVGDQDVIKFFQDKIR